MGTPQHTSESEEYISLLHCFLISLNTHTHTHTFARAGVHLLYTVNCFKTNSREWKEINHSKTSILSPLFFLFLLSLFPLALPLRPYLYLPLVPLFLCPPNPFLSHPFLPIIHFPFPLIFLISSPCLSPTTFQSIGTTCSPVRWRGAKTSLLLDGSRLQHASLQRS